MHLWLVRVGTVVLWGATGILSSGTFAADSPSAAMRQQARQILDATGNVVYSCKPSTGTEEILLNDGVLFLLVNPKRRQGDPPEPVVSNLAASSKTYGEYPKVIMAVDAATGTVLWQHTTPVLPMTLAADNRRVYFHGGEKICGLDRKTGEKVWTTPPVARARPIFANFTPTLIVYQDVVVFTGGGEAGTKSRGTTAAFDASTGKQLWTVPDSGTSSSSPTSLFGIAGLVWYGDVGAGAVLGRSPGWTCCRVRPCKRFRPILTIWGTMPDAIGTRPPTSIFSRRFGAWNSSISPRNIGT